MITWLLSLDESTELWVELRTSEVVMSWWWAGGLISEAEQQETHCWSLRFALVILYLHSNSFFFSIQSCTLTGNPFPFKRRRGNIPFRNLPLCARSQRSAWLSSAEQTVMQHLGACPSLLTCIKPSLQVDVQRAPDNNLLLLSGRTISKSPPWISSPLVATSQSTIL